MLRCIHAEILVVRNGIKCVIHILKVCVDELLSLFLLQRPLVVWCRKVQKLQVRRLDGKNGRLVVVVKVLRRLLRGPSRRLRSTGDTGHGELV